MAELDRRDFLKLAGVGAGAAATTGCYRAAELPEQLIPYVVQPEEITPGIANYYASTSTECAAGCGIHVRTREGRPIKLEGNPDHPINQGALCARCQASIGRTYHPDRFRSPQQRGADGSLTEVSWEDATALLAQKLAIYSTSSWPPQAAARASATRRSPMRRCGRQRRRSSVRAPSQSSTSAARTT
jgi:molybdopterin-containing oxidoreductase family iron-sulfur binding subunit